MKIRHRIRDIGLIFTALSSITIAVLAIYLQSTFLVVTSRSMEPNIQAGDTLITRMVEREKIQVDKVLVLPVPDSTGATYSHRVIDVKQRNSEVILKTKGDGNPKPDDWTLEIRSKKVPEVIAVIPTTLLFNGPVSRENLVLSLFTGGLALLTFSFLGFLSNAYRKMRSKNVS